MKTTLVCLIIVFSCNIFSQSKIEYFVSPNGNDQNPGTYRKPFATINRALKDIPSDTNKIFDTKIYVLPGKYDQYVLIKKSGRLNHPLQILAYNPKNKPTFYGYDVPVFNDKSAVFRWGNSYNYIIVDGIIFRNVTANDNMRGVWIMGDHNILRNCELYAIKRTGIVVQGNYNLIEYNIVDGITGSSDHSLRGNSISIESYYKDPQRINCNNNIIQHNRLVNNPTHFGVNIFPVPDDPEQPLMSGNKIFFNYIDRTGGGIYVRYQKDLVIEGNKLLNTIKDPSWGAPGGAITFDTNGKGNPHSVPYNGGSIKISGNVFANNPDYAIKDNNVNSLVIKNNFFVDSLFQKTECRFIIFNLSAKTIQAVIDSNNYSGSCNWRWGLGNIEHNFDEWKKVSGQDKHGKNSNP